MKRASSSTKENATRNTITKLSSKKRPLEHHQSALSSTQTFFPTTPASFHPSTPTNHPFYKTLSTNHFLDWHRPESKQAYRRFGGRPETSKGVRPMEKVPRKQYDIKGGVFHSQYMADRNEDYYREEPSSHIEIIVTNSKKRGENPRGNKSKFETDLDDEFLQLFAN